MAADKCTVHVLAGMRDEWLGCVVTTWETDAALAVFGEDTHQSSEMAGANRQCFNEHSV